MFIRGVLGGGGGLAEVGLRDLGSTIKKPHAFPPPSLSLRKKIITLSLNIFNILFYFPTSRYLCSLWRQSSVFSIPILQSAIYQKKKKIAALFRLSIPQIHFVRSLATASFSNIVNLLQREYKMSHLSTLQQKK